MADLVWDVGVWDTDTWAATATGVYTTPGFCPDYLRFQLSGVNLGLYIFDVNPTNYDIYPKRATGGYSTIMDSDPTVNRDYMKYEVTLRWRRMSERMWNQLQPYSRKNVDGTSETMYFWDAQFNRFFEKQVRIEMLEGRILAGNLPIDRFDVKLRIREV